MDESELGKIAEAYCGALVETGLPVRLISTVLAEIQYDGRGRSDSVWDRRRALLITPTPDGLDFVNVVCSDPVNWMNMRTDGVRNFLLLGDIGVPLQVSTFASLSTAMHGAYDKVFAPTDTVAEAVAQLTGKRPERLPPAARTTPDVLRALFQGS